MNTETSSEEKVERTNELIVCLFLLVLCIVSIARDILYAAHGTVALISHVSLKWSRESFIDWIRLLWAPIIGWYAAFSFKLSRKSRFLLFGFVSLTTIESLVSLTAMPTEVRYLTSGVLQFLGLIIYVFSALLIVSWLLWGRTEALDNRSS